VLVAPVSNGAARCCAVQIKKSGEFVMKMPVKLLAAAAFAAGASGFAVPAGAAPITAPSSLQNAASAPVESVQWRRWGGWRGWGPGLAAGAIVGGAIAASRPWYGYGYYNNYDDYAYSPYGTGPSGYNSYNYDYAPGGYSYGPGYSYSAGGNDDAYCSQRFRSYDPSSGTYLGYDGRRHPCP
jgi:BA14K-like protein